MLISGGLKFLEQLTETENRCKFLQEQLSSAIELNSELQRNEANFKEKILKLPTEAEFEELMIKLRNAENNVVRANISIIKECLILDSKKLY